MTCNIAGCKGINLVRGWCAKHYQRWVRTGDPEKLLRRENGTGTCKSGYRRIQINGKHKLAHILIVERVLGKKLPAEAVVHHVNGDRLDNRNTNLVVCPSRAYHVLIHYRERALAASGNASFLKCGYCKQYDAPANITERMCHSVKRHIRYHKKCKAEDTRLRYLPHPRREET